MISIGVDAMGGDNMPRSNVLGAVEAVKASDEIRVVLFGDEKAIREILKEAGYTGDRIDVVHTSSVITTEETPVNAIQRKPDSSIVVGYQALKKQEIDAFVSAGSTGAVLVGGQVIAGRLKKLRRAPLAIAMPTLKGKSLLIDCGANVDAKPEWLLQFAILGSVYMENVYGIKEPTVGLVNIGTEEEKGNDLTHAAFPLLKNCGAIRFIGNVEARDLPAGPADVYVCDAFTGNVVLKVFEGTAKTLMKQIKGSLMGSFTGKMGGLLIKKPLKKLVSTFDSSEDGGAPLLGLTGLVVKAHGNSTEVQIKNAILQCIEFSHLELNRKFTEALEKIS